MDPCLLKAILADDYGFIEMEVVNDYMAVVDFPEIKRKRCF